MLQCSSTIITSEFNKFKTCKSLRMCNILIPSVWLWVGWVGATPTQILGMTSTLLMFGWLCWNGLAPTLIFVWLEELGYEMDVRFTPLVGPTCHPLSPFPPFFFLQEAREPRGRAAAGRVQAPPRSSPPRGRAATGASYPTLPPPPRLPPLPCRRPPRARPAGPIRGMAWSRRRPPPARPRASAWRRGAGAGPDPPLAAFSALPRALAWREHGGAGPDPPLPALPLVVEGARPRPSPAAQRLGLARRRERGVAGPIHCRRAQHGVAGPVHGGHGGRACRGGPGAALGERAGGGAGRAGRGRRWASGGMRQQRRDGREMGAVTGERDAASQRSGANSSVKFRGLEPTRIFTEYTSLGPLRPLMPPSKHSKKRSDPSGLDSFSQPNTRLGAKACKSP